MAGATSTAKEATKEAATTGSYKIGNYSLSDVKYGDKGEHVKFLQQLLTAKGFACTADGVFGSNTEKALANYDVSIHNIKCGKGTWESLLK